MWAKILYKLCKMSDDTKELILEIICTIWNEHFLLLCTAIALILSYRYYKKTQANERKLKWDSAGQDVVVLHGFQRGFRLPSLSPFVLKLETYLKLSKIKYEYDQDTPKGPKGKTPWITLNGEDISDSEIIMNRLGIKYGIDHSKHLTPEQKGATKAIAVMVDEFLFWGLEWWYFLKDTEHLILKEADMPSYYKYMMFIPGRHIKKALWTQGLGRHSDAEIESFVRKQLLAVSQYLGEKKFLGGNEPCEADCNVFGMLAQFVWGMPGSPFRVYIKNDLSNLIDYLERMKEKVWPDWEKHLDK